MAAGLRPNLELFGRHVMAAGLRPTLGLFGRHAMAADLRRGLFSRSQLQIQDPPWDC